MYHTISSIIRSRAVAAITIFACMVSFWSCSGDPTTLGSGLLDDLLGTKPPVVSVDTLPVIDDVSHAFNTLVTESRELEVGRFGNYTRVIVIRPDHSDADLALTVATANLSLKWQGNAFSTINVRFYTLGTKYSEGDSIAAIDTIAPIVDPSTNSVERTLRLTPALYELPGSLVNGWIDGSIESNGIAIISTIVADDSTGVIGSTEDVPGEGESDDRPTLRINYTNNEQKTFRMAADATMYRPIEESDNLIISDAYVRRLYFNVDLSVLDPDVAIHNAFLRFHVVPEPGPSGTEIVVLYVPDDSDPLTPGFLTGRLAPADTLFITDSKFDIPLDQTVLSILEGTVNDTGFVIRYVGERQRLRCAEFYSSTTEVDSLRPRLFVSSSSTAEFDE